MNDTAPTARAKPLTGRTVLLCLLAFFGVVVGVNMVMMMLAIRTLPGTEVDSAYRASVSFNREIAAAREQAALGWQVTARIEHAPDGRAHVNVEARDAHGAPLTGLAISARLQRPIDKRADRLLTLAERETGIYRGGAKDVAAGQWTLVVEAARANERVFLSRHRVFLK
jgi:nitrogen fixation protein FixH